MISDREKTGIGMTSARTRERLIERLRAQGIRHPGVLEAACIGIPDERSGERVKIFVVPKPGKTATAEDIVAYCREHLTGYKVPREVEFRDELPKTNVGKILRRALRES